MADPSEEPNPPRATPRGNGLETQLQLYLDSIESGNYQRTVRTQLDHWKKWNQHQDTHAESVEDISVIQCRRYARHLKNRSRNQEIKPSTAHTYYSVFRAFLTFCVDEELIDSNPGAVKRARDELPTDNGDRDRQFWSEEVREKLIRSVDDAVVDNQLGFRSVRDKAFAYVIGYTGVRGAEIFKDPSDPQRNGAIWNDLDLDNGTLKVLGKSREYEYAQVPQPVQNALTEYRYVLAPGSQDWPLFPSLHKPSLYRILTEKLEEEQRKNVLNNGDTLLHAFRETGVVPPALSKNGARSMLQRLGAQADVQVDGEPLKLHGARRGLGHDLYSKGYSEVAQSALRHSSIDITHESYSDIKAGETAENVSQIIDKK